VAFTLASLAFGGAAPSEDVLVAARAVQGAAAMFATPGVPVVNRGQTPNGERDRFVAVPFGV
jgi:hypothetical protein